MIETDPKLVRIRARKLKHKQKTYAKDSFFYQLPKEVQAMMLAH